MQILKADTEIKVVIGPVVAVANGYVPVTNLDLSTADEAEIMKHNAASVTDISGYTFAAIASADGYYNLTIAAAALDTEGMLTVLINDDSLCLPVKAEFMVVNANVYDSLFAAATTDYLQVDTIQVSGTAQTANDNGADINAILTDTGTTLDGKLDTIDGIVDDILVDTGTTLDGKLDTIDGIVDDILVDTGTTLDGKINTIDTVVDAIQAVTDALPDAGALTTIDGIVDAILVDTDTTIPALIAALENLSAAEVNAEVVDALGTDTLSELSQGIPSATPTIKAAIMLIYMALRNKLTVTSSELGVYNDAGTKIAKKALSDDATTYTEGEMASGA